MTKLAWPLLLVLMLGLGLTPACGDDGGSSRDRDDARGDDDDDGDDDTGVIVDGDDDDDAPNGNTDAGANGGKLDAAADASGSNNLDASTLLDSSLNGSDASASEDDASTSEDDASASEDDASADESDAAEPPDDAATQPDAATDPERPKPKCVKKDSQVIVIGDSYINWITHSFPQDMIKESGQTWRMEAIGGWAMATGGTGLIPDQFDSSIKRDPDAHTVLMDGGGNDLLIGDSLRQCRDAKAPTIPFCQKLVTDALAAADKLLERAANAGIRDVVYFYYPRVPKNTLLGGPDPNVMLEYSLPMVRDFCESSEQRSNGKLRCYFVDMVPVFAGMPESQWFFPGDIHPTSVGSKAMAKAVWKTMKDNCVAQKPESGCCEP